VTSPSKFKPQNTDLPADVPAAFAQVAPQVRLRAYSHFTFGHPAPFKFLVPSIGPSVNNTLRFDYRAKGGKEWVKPIVNVRDNEEGCVEVLVSGESIGGAEWEVQVERI
jgi:hypothetical protein